MVPIFLQWGLLTWNTSQKISDFQIRFLVMWRDFILFANLEIMDLWTLLQDDAVLNPINIQLK